LYARVKAGTFPRPIRLGSHAVGWLESEVDQWIDQQRAARDAAVSDQKA
jgi:prophage regulatory protein